MRISDWSSDVCSSDLLRTQRVAQEGKERADDLRRSAREGPRKDRAWASNSRSPGGRAPNWPVGWRIGLSASSPVRGSNAQYRQPVRRLRECWSQILVLPTASVGNRAASPFRSEEQTSELQSLMRISYAVFCLNKK